MDDFEKHISKNRHLFDEHTVDKNKLWEHIESELNPVSKVKTVKLWQSPMIKIAATIIILIGVFSLASIFTASNQSSNVANQELMDIDSYYKGLVSFQVQLVNNNDKLLASDKEEFLSFMDELDKEYELLKKEMENNFNNEYILEAIVNNYKKRIELIENLLEQINDSKKTDDNEGYIL
ncbi:hypothetical protein [Aquimarina sp. 2201CG14-23]|uniref:hypothetical protein n=1 Tax=Aquimarina mycalae TaxID=3040073 RepID=UPI002477E6D1|nr:hypothetical protein [Aquimarina sp. 2201CG14-23]MDH7448234.1 hypothetical protein [Aquimarina sp. 2201CG14-23]